MTLVADPAEPAVPRIVLILWKRVVAAAFAVVAVVVASFSILRLIPGDPAVRVAGPDASPAQVVEIRRSLGLDGSFLHQLKDYVHGIFTGNLGVSFDTQQQVTTIIGDRLPKTLELAAAGFVVAVGFGIPVGLIVGALTRVGQRRGLAAAFAGGTSLVRAVPDYLMASLLVLVFAVTFHVLPVAGANGFRSLILPGIAVGAGAAAILARVTKVETATVLSLDYVRAARAKNLSKARIYLRHVLPNVVTAALTISGLVLTSLVGGAVVVENVFAWPGLGTELVRAVSQRDYPVIQAVVLLLGVTIVVINTMVDLTIAALDPRSALREG